MEDVRSCYAVLVGWLAGSLANVLDLRYRDRCCCCCIGVERGGYGPLTGCSVVPVVPDVLAFVADTGALSSFEET